MADDLRRQGRNGFGVSSLRNLRQFALSYPSLQKHQTLFGVFASLAGTSVLRASRAESAPPSSLPSVAARGWCPLGLLTYDARAETGLSETTLKMYRQLALISPTL